MSDGRDEQGRGEGLERQIERLEDRRASKEGARAAGDLRGQRARSSAERLLTRSTSGAIYAVVTLVCILASPITTTALVVAEAWLCCSEFFRICRMGGRMPNDALGLACALVLPVAAFAKGLLACAVVLCVLLMICACWYVFTPRASVADVAVTVFAPLYTSFTLSCLIVIRQLDSGIDGALVTLGVMFSVWVNDAFAYFVGSAIGAHKLVPRISPNKSVEGFVGGLVGSVIVWVVLALFVIDGLSVAGAVAYGLAVGLAAVVGDLFESRLKRGVGVKDSGNLMPGHGGLLDRSDSMLFGGMAALFLLMFGGVL